MMNVTTDVQSTTEETKEKRYKTLFGSALGYAAEGLDMLLLSFVLVYILKEFHSRLTRHGASGFITGRPSSNDMVLLIWGEDIEARLNQLL
ncbi:hypothetical protein P7M24_25375, partial [Vibrio parahaemolyticus]|nr:hypothetical protein [Vibrio parahaemolyticus]